MSKNKSRRGSEKQSKIVNNDWADKTEKDYRKYVYIHFGASESVGVRNAKNQKAISCAKSINLEKLCKSTTSECGVLCEYFPNMTAGIRDTDLRRTKAEPGRGQNEPIGESCKGISIARTEEGPRLLSAD